MDVEVAANKLVALIIAGVAIVIALGISYTNLGQGTTQITSSGASNAIIANYTTNAGAVANTAGSNGNYAYYILFMALILSVILGALYVKRKVEQG